MIEIIKTDIADLNIIKIRQFEDERGFFCERYNQQQFHNAGIKNEFVQDNHSFSEYGVIRGLHYQKNPDQAKLVSCVSGKILDVAVDIRKNSKTFGKSYSIELSRDNGLMLMIPAGFAHGFSVLSSKGADVWYKVDGLYNKEGEGGIRFDDKKLDIDWKITNPTFSERDKNQQSFEQYKNNPIF